MIYIILASIFAGFGSYILRKGDLLNFINGLITFNFSNLKFVDYTITGIILNLIAIFLWQSSFKSNFNFSTALSIYESLTLLTGVMISLVVDKSYLGSNFYFGTILIISGIIILSKNAIN